LLIPTDQDEGNTANPAETSWDNQEDSSLLHHVSSSEIKELLQSLPRNLHRDKEAKSASVAAAASDATAGLETLEEGEDEGEEEQTDEGLTIAWQYRKDVQRERLGQVDAVSTASEKSSGSDVFCHSYDLQGRLHSQMDTEQAASIVPMQGCQDSDSGHGRKCGILYYRRLLVQLKDLLSKNPRRVVRLLLYHPNLTVMNVALPLLLTHIRTHLLPVVLLVTVQPWTSSASPTTMRLLQRACDVVLETEGFASRRDYPPPPEFRSLHGLLKIRKMSTVTAATAHGGGHFCDLTVTKRPAANLYGLKRDRRKLHIQLLHIPPEDYAEGGGSVGGGGVRSGAGRPAKKETSASGCGTGSGASPLDF
jgi:ribosomal protein L12E/L44/L45/RPP1/RPP2